MSHVVLLGDSIFDNARYVPGKPPVIQQLQRRLPAGWQATLLARDGHIALDVVDQLRHLPADATHLVVSAGGNDALSQHSVVFQSANSTEEILERLWEVGSDFRKEYRRMLLAVVGTGRSVMVCTVYEDIPGLEGAAKAGLVLFNDAILREAFAAQVPVLDLRLLCTEPSDYSSLSPIEPSALGGEKITATIAAVLTSHDFSPRQCVVFP
jgi:hypothetical protein